MKGLKNKIAVMTGGLGDLGYATAQRLYEEGCTIVLLDLQPAEKEKLASLGAVFYQVDISKEHKVKAISEEIERSIGPTHILINAAASFIFKGIEATVEDWATINATNISGTSLMAKYIVPHMKKNGGGSIINFSSVSGFIGQANFATYNVTKFAIRGLTKCWA
jgi:dihydroanticapsin dehydrogenase